MSHENSGQCPKCQEILDRYADFNEDLREWFEEFQGKHPEAHISCAGRGRVEQEEYFQRGATRAHYGQSSHNYNCALDLFVLRPGENNLYPSLWFEHVLQPEIPPWINWYGELGARFYELPHIEVRAWKDLITKGLARLVE